MTHQILRFMKRIFFFLSLLAALFWLPASVFGQATCLLITGGSEDLIVSLGDKPEVTFTSESLVLTTATRVAEFPIDSALEFQFIEGSGIADFARPVARFEITAGGVQASGLAPQEPVQVFSLAGRMIVSSQAGEDGSWQISSDALPSEPIIIKTANHSFKAIIRK